MSIAQFSKSMHLSTNAKEQSNTQVVSIDNQNFPVAAIASYKLSESLFLYKSNLIFENKKTKISQAASRALHLLHENKNKLVTKNQIMEYAWFGRTVVQNNVNVIISELRTALRCSEYEIITVRGMGFILVAEKNNEY